MRDVTESLLRRWYLVVLALVLTAGVGLVAAKAMSPTYRTEASVVLIPPKGTVDPTENQFLNLAGLSQAVDVLSRSLNDDEVHALVAETAPDGTFEVMRDGATSAPVLVIAAKAESAADADAVVTAVLEQVPVNLSALQSALAIRQGAEITSLPLDRDDEPVASQKTRVRAIAAVMLLCLIGSTLLIGMVDGLLLVRSWRRQTNGAKRRPNGVDGQGDDVDGNWVETQFAAIASGEDGSGTEMRAARRPGREDRPRGDR